MHTLRLMKTSVKNPFILSVLIAGLGSILAFRGPAQTFTTLHSFTRGTTNSLGFYTNSEGFRPFAGLLLSRNTFYGTTGDGGSSGYGTVFALKKDGTDFTNLHNFSDGIYDFDPNGGLA